MSALDDKLDAVIAEVAKPKEQPKRYAADGKTELTTGHQIGHANRQGWETTEEKRERLTSGTDQTPEAFGRILLDVEETKALMGLQDDEAPRTSEENEALVSRAVLATAIAADEVVSAHQPTYAGRIEAHREAAFREAFDQQDDYEPESEDVREATHEAVSAEAKEHPLNLYNPNPNDGVTLHGAPEDEEDFDIGSALYGDGWDDPEAA